MRCLARCTSGKGSRDGAPESGSSFSSSDSGGTATPFMLSAARCTLNAIKKKLRTAAPAPQSVPSTTVTSSRPSSANTSSIIRDKHAVPIAILTVSVRTADCTFMISPAFLISNKPLFILSMTMNVLSRSIKKIYDIQGARPFSTAKNLLIFKTGRHGRVCVCLLGCWNSPKADLSVKKA